MNVMLFKRHMPFALATLMVVAACGAEQGGEAGESAAAETQEEAGGAGAMQNPHGAMEMPGQGGVTRITYGCAEGNSFQLVLHEGTGEADLVMGEETVTLASDRAASGMRFTDGTWVFHGKGPEALVEKDGERVYSDCKASGHP
jgi:membrane-bound inhibitor of C-type lysozyme